MRRGSRAILGPGTDEARLPTSVHVFALPGAREGGEKAVETLAAADRTTAATRRDTRALGGIILACKPAEWKEQGR